MYESMELANKSAGALPLPVSALRHRSPNEETSDRQVRILLDDFFLQSLAGPQEEGQLSFGEVLNQKQWSEVKQFRLECYPKSLPYMSKELGRDGSDDLDAQSCVFEARWKGKVVATTRFTPYPFETSRYVPDEKMVRFLGTKWPSEYLEWSRLLIDKEAPVSRLMPSLLAFAGLSVLSMTPYRCYFGYVAMHKQSVFRKFPLTVDDEPFVIPMRGDHSYTLLKGDFFYSLEHLKKWLQMSALATLVP